MASSSQNQNRIWTLDLLRGFMILLMTLAHTIHFTHNFTDPYLNLLNILGTTVSFTAFFFLSGATGYISYLHFNHPPLNLLNRLGKRLFIYLIGYYAIAIWASLVSNQASSINCQLSDINCQLSTIIKILTFQSLPPFTEFIIPLIVFGFLKFPFRKIYGLISRSLTATVITGAALYALGTWLYPQTLNFLPLSWKALLAGHPGWYTFPILQYSPIYLLGIYFGKTIHHQLTNNQKLNPKNLLLATGYLLLTTALTVTTLISTTDTPLPTIFNRWPPTPAFLLTGLIFAIIFTLIFTQLEDLKNHPWTRTLLLILGQNAFSVFITHTFLLYTYQLFSLPSLHSPLLVFVAWIISLALSLYLAKILPLNLKFNLTFINWCECHLAYCTHAQEHHLVKQLKLTLYHIFNLKKLFTVTYKNHTYRLVKKRHLLAGFTIVLLSATALGIADNYRIVKQDIESLQGRLNRTWVLTTDQNQPLIYTIKIPADIKPTQVTAILNTGQQFIMEEKELTTEYRQLTTNIPIHNLMPDIYQIQAQIILPIVGLPDTKYQTLATTFHISAPLYITWTIDWEGYDVNDQYLQALIDIADHYQIPMTHLFNPRIYTTAYAEKKLPDTNPTVKNVNTIERADYLTNWVKQRYELKNEEIGLHLHMFPDLATDAGITPKTEPVWGGGWTAGYDILTTAYNYEDMVKILTRAKGWFANQGLPAPKSYRAGAWFANLQILQALQDTNFLIDSSGRTPYTFGTNRTPGLWQLTSTTQPYYPSTTNQNSDSPSPTLNILEIPNNGADTFAFNAEQLIQRFEDNFPQKTFLTKPVQVTYLSHPHWFSAKEQQITRQLFYHISQWSYANNTGPVIFTTLTEIYQAFK